jgi:hypothetical protein
MATYGGKKGNGGGEQKNKKRCEAKDEEEKS